MKNTRYNWMYMAALSVLALGACQRMEEEDFLTGKEINFGISTGVVPSTRTSFSGDVVGTSDTYERIDWVEGDKIKVYSAEVTSPSNKQAEYTVKNHSASDRNSVAGVWTNTSLRWGEGEHVFYALYPSPASGNKATMDATTPNKVGGTIEKAVTLVKDAGGDNFYTNMNYAYMYAVTKAAPGAETVPLVFKPLMTAFEFTLRSSDIDPIIPDQANTDALKKQYYWLKSVTLSTDAADTWLAGTFTADLKPDGTYDLAVTDNANRSNQIVATLPNSGVALTPDSPVKITLLGLPMDQTRLTLTLTFYDRTRTQTLKTSAGEWYTVPAGEKLYICNERVPGLWVYHLEHTGTFETVDMGDSDHTVARVVTKTGANSGNTDAAASLVSYKTSNENNPAGTLYKTGLPLSDYSYARADIYGNLSLDENGKIVWLEGLPEEIASLATPVTVNNGTLTNAANGNGTFTASVKANTAPVIESVESELLSHARAMKAKGTNGFSASSPQDLSLYDIEDLTRPRSSGKPTTANCYVVDRAGWYMFPLVYGNAIDYSREGAPLYSNGVNRYAYKDETTTANTGTYFHNFQRFDATSVTTGLIGSPYILDDLSLVTDDVEAVVVWEDVAGAEYAMVQNVSITEMPSSLYKTVDGTVKSTVPYIKFQVPVGSVNEDVEIEPALRVTGVRPGNAVIAVRRKSDSMILWSWHIWLTDGWDKDGDGKGDGLSPLTVQTRSSGVATANEMMPVNLGWCDANTTRHYHDRVWYIRLRQSEGIYGEEPLSIVYKVIQTTAPGVTISGGTYYQWGRKDPFLPTRGSVVTATTTTVTSTILNKESYSPSGYVLVNAANTAVSYSGSAANNASLSIRNPYIHYYHNNNGWMSSAVYNLWNMANTIANTKVTTADYIVYKTVYDPCPPGYCIPHSRAYTFFSTTGGSTSTLSQFNVADRNGDGTVNANDYTDVETTLKGWYFFTDDAKAQTVFFPATGHRLNNSSVLQTSVNVNSYGWTAALYSATAAWGWNFNSGTVNPVGSHSRSQGLAVRAVREYTPVSGVSTGGMNNDPYELGEGDWGY